jgi:hypothetical protein
VLLGATCDRCVLFIVMILYGSNIFL